MFSNAIVRRPCPLITDGLTTASLGKPDYELALVQHSRYTETLRQCGLEVKILDKADKFPDSTFIEDVAVCTPLCAIITRPGAESRRGEISGMRQVLEEYYDAIEEIRYPGTLEGGDIMKTGNCYYIGISERTNNEGAIQLAKILSKYGMKAITIPGINLLHLKSGVSYLDKNDLLIASNLTHLTEFRKFKMLTVDPSEDYAANSLWINGTVLVPEGFPETRERLEKAGYKTVALNVSEFRKLDGGLSCLSLRF
jgi:dimethylargininase